ncbi:MAG: hypothetical protein ABR574_13110 [Cryomorphaceae bacterium]|nr:hypothetical protein [Flavobacteriales bacterium]
MKKLIVASIMGAVFLIGCQKDEFEDNPISSDIYSHKKVSVNPANAHNRMDSAGVEHNRILNNFLLDELFDGDVLSKGEAAMLCGVLAADTAYLVKNFDYGQDDSNSYSAPLAISFQNNQAVFQYFFDLRDIAGNQSLTLGQKIDAIKLYEQNYNYLSHPIDEANCLRVMSSIARYSLYFWAPKSQGGLGNYDLLLAGGPKAPINWWRVGVDDIWGACLAAFTTANPFVALGWGAGTSACSAFTDWAS